MRCELFRCAKRALTFRGAAPWCRWTDERCSPKDCTYAVCIKRRLLPTGICGFTVRRKTAEETRPEEFMKEEIKVRGRVLRRLGEKEIL